MIYTNKYERWYWTLMNKALIREEKPSLGEKHHIFPLCIYGKNNFIVKLTYREHYIAHLLLAKFLGHKHSKLWFALTRMNKPGVYNSRVYSIVKKQVSEIRALKNREEFDYTRVLPILHLNNSRLQNRPWKNFNTKKENLIFWKKADIVHDAYISKEYPNKKLYSYLSDKIGLPPQKIKILRNMLKLIDSGWNPIKDTEWLQLVNA